MPKRFRDCEGVEDYCRVLQHKGISPGENAFVGVVYPVHSGWQDKTWSSGHFKVRRDGQEVVAPKTKPLRNPLGQIVETPQGKLAVDVNDNSVADDHLPFDDETEALNWLYDKTFDVFGPRGFNVLDEIFFAGRGWVKEDSGNHNHPQPGHTTHLHVRFKKLYWKEK